MNESKRSVKKSMIAVILILLLVLFDQFTKHLAVTGLKDTSGIDLIPGVLRLQYLENAGMAWGMFQNKQVMFILLTAVFLVAAVWFYLRIPAEKKYFPLRLCVTVLAAGAIGNLIDRVMHQYVVDFIYFKIIDFPIFNVADIYVSLSVIALVILMLFRYKDQDLAFLSRKRSEA